MLVGGTIPPPPDGGHTWTAGFHADGSCTLIAGTADPEQLLAGMRTLLHDLLDVPGLLAASCRPEESYAWYGLGQAEYPPRRSQ